MEVFLAGWGMLRFRQVSMLGGWKGEVEMERAGRKGICAFCFLNGFDLMGLSLRGVPMAFGVGKKKYFTFERDLRLLSYCYFIEGSVFVKVSGYKSLIVPSFYL
jgi:hypothetical protein